MRQPAMKAPAMKPPAMKPSANLATAGSVALEYGLALPAIIMLMMTVMDLTRLMWTYTTLQRSVQAAARCASVNPTVCGSSSQITGVAVTEAWGLGGVSASIFTAQTETCGHRVTANYDFPILIPWVVGEGGENAMTLTLSACYPLYTE
jgi:hypothetical protein